MTFPIPVPIPVKKTQKIHAYRLIGDGPSYRFFAIAYPPGCRPVYAFDDTEEAVTARVKALLR